MAITVGDLKAFQPFAGTFCADPDKYTATPCPGRATPDPTADDPFGDYHQWVR